MLSPAALAVSLLASGAWSSVRPPECADDHGRSANVWERAKLPELRRYCDAIAGSSSRLAGTAIMAQSALEMAREAERLLPGRAASRVLEGRALAALGRPDLALAALREGRARDPRALDQPVVLLVWARVLARTGHSDEAVEAYRALLPRAGSLSIAERAAAALEAGLTAMACGHETLDEAVAALRLAMRWSQDDVEAVAVLALGLALDRRAEAAEARMLLSDRAHGDPRGALATERARELLAVAPAEGPALAAIALEATDLGGARDAWQEYLDGASSSPWAAHARAHLAALTRGRPAARPGR